MNQVKRKYAKEEIDMESPPPINTKSGQINLNNILYDKPDKSNYEQSINQNKKSKKKKKNNKIGKLDDFNLLTDSSNSDEKENKINDKNKNIQEGLNKLMQGSIFKNNNLMDCDNIINNDNDSINKSFHNEKIFEKNIINNFMKGNQLFDENSFLAEINNEKENILEDAKIISDSQIQHNKPLEPKDYQLKIYNEAKDKNSIIFMETGKGKTFISIMLLSRVLGIDIVENKGNINKMKIKNKKIIFLICDTSLVNQQVNAIQSNLGIEVGILQGKKQKKSKNDYFEFRKLFQSKNIFVAIHNVIYKLLSTGFLQISEIDMLIFDECHHTDSSHPYNDIMNEFYFFYKKNNPNYKLPLILGLTASPLKTSLRGDIKSNANNAFVTLSENLDSEVIIDPDNYLNDIELKDENDVEQFLEKEKFIKVDDDTNNKNYKIISEEIINNFYFQFTKICCRILKIIKNDIIKEYQDFNFNDFEKNYNDFIIDKFKSKTDEDYNDIVNKNIDLYNLKNKHNIFHIYEKVQKQIFLIFHNLDLNCLINYFRYSVKMYLEIINDNDLEKKNLDIDIEIEEIFQNEIKSLNINIIKHLYSIFENMKNRLCEIFEKNNLFYQSNRIIKMFKEIEEIFIENKESKIIIFVENRIVAYYLEGVITKFLMEKYKNRYQCTTVIGVNKKKNQNRAIINPSNTIKQLNEKINGFNKGNYNILIGTGAIEEGLDIQSCNIVMVFTELRTPKSYIQMKGRARKKKSKFLTFSFYPDKTKKNILDFIKLNIIMKQLFKDSIRRDFRKKDFIKNKNIDKYYIIDENSQAKITLHNSASFYNEILQLLNNYNYKTKCEIKVEKRLAKSGPNEFEYIGIFTIESDIKELNLLNQFKSPPKLSKISAENECKFEFIKLLKKIGRIDEHIKVIK